MTDSDSLGRRRFYRNRSKAMIGGVCAGLADYFGFNLRVTRILMVISLLMAFPATMLAYFGVVFLVPSAPKVEQPPDYDEAFRKAVRSDPRQTMAEVGRRYKKIDARLAKLERYVTSPRFNLDQEFRNL